MTVAVVESERGFQTQANQASTTDSLTTYPADPLPPSSSSPSLPIQSTNSDSQQTQAPSQSFSHTGVDNRHSDLPSVPIPPHINNTPVTRLQSQHRYSLPPVSGIYTQVNSLAPSARTSGSFTHVDHSTGNMDNPDERMVEVGPGLQGAQPHSDIQLEPNSSPLKSSSSSPPSPSHASPSIPSPTNADTSPSNLQSQPASEAVPQSPQVTLCFLLISGRRRVMSFDPDMTVGRVKELVWNAWPSEWEDERPPAPSYLRILYLGKILQNEDTLTKLNFPIWPPTSDNEQSAASPPQPTIVHLSIRPFAPDSSNDGDGLKKKKGSRFGRSERGSSVSGGDGAAPGGEDGDAATPGSGGCCGCVIC